MTKFAAAGLGECLRGQVAHGINLQPGHPQPFDLVQAAPQGQAKGFQADADAQAVHGQKGHSAATSSEARVKARKGCAKSRKTAPGKETVPHLGLRVRIWRRYASAGSARSR